MTSSWVTWAGVVASSRAIIFKLNFCQQHQIVFATRSPEVSRQQLCVSPPLPIEGKNSADLAIVSKLLYDKSCARVFNTEQLTFAASCVHRGGNSTTQLCDKCDPPDASSAIWCNGSWRIPFQCWSNLCPESQTQYSLRGHDQNFYQNHSRNKQ